MGLKVKDFISSNKNNGVKWILNSEKEMFIGYDSFPENLLEQYVFEWKVKPHTGAIEIMVCDEDEYKYDEQKDLIDDYNDRMRNDSDKHSEFMEMQSMYEEGLLEG